jgi:hypothetical protein
MPFENIDLWLDQIFMPIAPYLKPDVAVWVIIGRIVLSLWRLEYDFRSSSLDTSLRWRYGLGIARCKFGSRI